MASLTVEAKAGRMKERPGISEQEEAGGDAQLESAYRRHVALVYTLCLRLLATVQAAEEATVQVFAQFSRELSSWWDEARILARLRQLAIYESIARLPTHEPAKATDTSFGKAQSRGGGGGVGSVDSGTAPPTLDQPTLDALVARLPDQLRVAFVLRDREGLSDQTIATHLRVEEAEVRRLVGRARFELRRLWTSKLLIVALTYALLALCCPRFACFAQSQTQAQVVYSRAAEVTRIDGDVRLRRHGEAETTALLSGTRLVPDDLILTGAGGRAELSMGPDSYLQIGHDSYVRVYEVTASTIHFDVERGEVFVIVRSLPREISLIVDTPPAPLTIAKRGHYLVQVAADGATEVAVEKGELSFTDSGNKTVRIGAHRRAHLSSKPKGA